MSPSNTDEVQLLAVGPCYVGRSNMGAERRDAFNSAVDRAVTIAIDNDVDAVVQLGNLFGTRSPDAEFVTKLRESLSRLQSAGIPFLHTPSERDADMTQTETLYESELLTPLDASPTWVGDVVVYGTDPGRTLGAQAGELSVPDEATSAVLASHHAVSPPIEGNGVNLSTVESRLDPAVDTLLVGDSELANTHTGQVRAVAPGSPEPRLGKWLFKDEARDPYPATVTELRLGEQFVEVTDHELPHRPLLAIELTIDEGAGVDGVWSEISDLDYEDAAVLLNGWTVGNDPDLVAALEERLAEDAFVVNTWHKESGYTPSKGSVESTVDRYEFDPNVDDPALSVDVYRCSRDRRSETRTCQNCLSGKLFEDTEHRDTATGDTLVLFDYDKEVNPNSRRQWIYGPFIARSEAKHVARPDGGDDNLPYQVEVDWNQLYRLPADDCPVDIEQTRIIGDEAATLLDVLEEDGAKIRVTDGGIPEPIDSEPSEGENEPQDGESDAPEGDPDTPEGQRDVIKKPDHADLTPTTEMIEQASQPGVPILHHAVTGELRPELYREALVHLIAGKNVIFYGPPGSGKTRIAKRLCGVICPNVRIASANAEWTYQDVVGGDKPQGNGFEPEPGVLTSAAAACEQALKSEGRPEWLIIDELNRANLDEAFGEVFTLLDVAHRSDASITYADDRRQTVPHAFRILGTMNSEDQAQLFALGYAFRRRFAFVEVPALYETSDDGGPVRLNIDAVDLGSGFEQMNVILREEATAQLTTDVGNSDTPLGIPVLETVFNSAGFFEETRRSVLPPNTDLKFDRAILAFVQCLDELDIAQIGQGLILDAYKYVLSHYGLFPDATDWTTVDQAICAYLLPQLEAYMGELRRAETVAAESTALDDFESAIERADELGFSRTAGRMRDALDTHEIF